MTYVYGKAKTSQEAQFSDDSDARYINVSSSFLKKKKNIIFFKLLPHLNKQDLCGLFFLQNNYLGQVNIQ